jgi:diguanylate cyclase (GGDEF)-like protein
MLPEGSEFKTLILSKDETTKGFLKSLVEGEGWTLVEAANESAVIDALIKNKFDLLLIDFETSNAIEICKQIRSNFSLRYLPVMVLIEKSRTIEKIKTIYAGADDYIEKPIESGEILTRMKVNLWRASRDLDANPLTRLPGNVTILKEIKSRLNNSEEFCVAYADINKFKEYNDYYGFEWGDKVIQHTASIITTALRGMGTKSDFLGHIGGDDFIFVTDWASIKDVCETIIDNFDKTIPSFYKEEDLKRGYIIVKNREGKITASSVLTLSIGVATNKNRPLKHVGEVVQIATELKAYAKTFSKSIYTIDRRT